MKKAITKNVNILTGWHSGLRGDCTGLRGDLDACEITATDRDAGIDITDLIA